MTVLHLTLGMGNQPGLWQCLEGQQGMLLIPWACWHEGREEQGLGGESHTWLGSTAQNQLLAVPGCATGQAGTGERYKQQLKHLSCATEIWEVGSSLQALINTGGDQGRYQGTPPRAPKTTRMFSSQFPTQAQGCTNSQPCHTCGTA